MFDPVVLGRRIRNVREKLGLTRAAAARASGIAYPTIVSVERGEALPALYTLSALADAYGTTVAALLGEAPLPYSVEHGKAMRNIISAAKDARRMLDRLIRMYEEMDDV